MSVVVCKMPNAGLGNQLFPLMKSLVKQRLSGLPLTVTNYAQWSIGPYLRREKSKRRYQGYFIFQKGLIGQWKEKWKLKRWGSAEVWKEAALDNQQFGQDGQPCVFEYSALPHYSEYFKGLKDHRDLVLECFSQVLSQTIKNQSNAMQAPCVGVHIRMGDFRKLKEGEDFSKVGAVRTPEKYFIEVINTIREIAGTTLPVTIFTDGYRHEFETLFDLPAITMAEKNPDIVDMICLSRSKVIVTSADSTFSYWAGFMSDAALILHPDHIHSSIRPRDMGEIAYEGPLRNRAGEIDPLLQRQIASIAN